MRSELVHTANQRLSNRFLLCRMTSAAAKRIRGSSEAFPVSINQALKRIAALRPEENGHDTEKPPLSDGSSVQA
jgi:hypothetical protein